MKRIDESVFQMSQSFLLAKKIEDNMNLFTNVAELTKRLDDAQALNK